MASHKIKKPKMTKEQVAENKKRTAFSKQIADIFNNAGFINIPVRGLKFELGGRNNELDHVFIYENILIISEDTIRFVKEKEKAAIQNIPFNRNHKAEKEETSRIIFENKKSFFDLLKAKFTSVIELQKYSWKEFKVFYFYFEYNVQRYSENDKLRYTHLLLIDKSTLNYFSLMSKSIKASFKYEIFKFLNLFKKSSLSKTSL